MKQTYDHPYRVLQFCASNSDAALVIVTQVTGGTLRSSGAMMAVTAHDVAGYISNGCVDADIITRARAGQSGSLVYGTGSPFRDIILPCGGSIHVELVQRPDRKAVLSALTDLQARRAANLIINDMSVRLVPTLCIRIAGRGAAFIALAELATAAGFEVCLQSPDANIHPDAQHLIDPSAGTSSVDDPWTAVVLLFHDHDWEPEILREALASPAFYIGAMGSAKTHAARRDRLSELGVPNVEIDRIRGPIGLVPAQRDARCLAVSILAEIIQAAPVEGVL
ncbi:lipoprotein [Litorimonas cladophorae]|uniref:Lipoprotein n=1 Tax=Litorimonas cladophorae TaxID=1220491 RepID=A0A918NCP7_9PROT|nr:XdhC family protein [Litorimonas cladophorae]GGX62769.1 lipoprotein [Litorimonas cladophorae]